MKSSRIFSRLLNWNPQEFPCITPGGYVKRSYFAGLALGMAIVIAGCGKKDSEVQKAEPAGGARRGIVALHGSPGADGGAATVTYMKELSFLPANGYAEDVDCEGNCDGEQTLNLTIEPEASSHLADWREAMSAGSDSGYVVARIRNTTSKRFGPLGLAPGDTIYLWVGPITPTLTRHRVAWVKINLSNGATGPYRRSLNSVRHCTNIGTTPPNEPRAKKVGMGEHTGCDTDKAVDAAQAESSDSSDVARQLILPPGLWLSCSGGCCQASQT
jgi:hypothetical protein